MSTQTAEVTTAAVPKLTINQRIADTASKLRAAVATKEDLLAQISTLTTERDDAINEAANLQATNDECTRVHSDLTAQISTLTGERDNALAEVADLKKKATTVSEQTIEQVAALGFPAENLPKTTATQAVSAPQTAEEYVKAITSEKNPDKRGLLFKEYEAKYLDAPAAQSAHRN
jgi:chromosome segregation ATPase